MAAETNVERLQRIAREKEQKLELQIAEENKMFTYEKLEEMTGFQKDMITVLHRSVAKDTTPAELAYFLTVCKQWGLNPVNKEIWCYKNNRGDLLVFTGRDGFLKKNKENPNYRGMKHSAVCEEDDFLIDMVNGQVVKHTFGTKRGKPIGAYCYVYIEGQKDTFVYIDFAEFNLGQAKWNSAPAMMIDKCAQSLALKEAAGMTGIQADEAARIEKGIVTFDVKHEEIKAVPPDSEVKSEERLLKMIEEASSKSKLMELYEHCVSTESKIAYDQAFAKFQE